MIDSTDKRILYELDIHARIPDTDIAKKVGKSKEAVRYRIRKMEEAGIIDGYITWVDPTHLGYRNYKLYLRLANIPEERDRLYAYLQQHPTVFWLAQGDGVWNLAITFIAKSRIQFYEMKQQLFGQFPNLIMRYTMLELVDVLVYPRDFFIDNTHRKPVCRLMDASDTRVVDDVDYRIIRQLIRSSRKQATDIADEIGVSDDTVGKRMKKLERAGIIARYTIGIDYTKIGMHSFKSFIYCRHFTKEDEKKLIAFIEKEPNIFPLVRTIGPWDVELEIIVESYMQYSQIIDRLEKAFTDMIVDIETTVMRTDVVYPAGDIAIEQ